MNNLFTHVPHAYELLSLLRTCLVWKSERTFQGAPIDSSTMNSSIAVLIIPIPLDRRNTHESSARTLQPIPFVVDSRRCNVSNPHTILQYNIHAKIRREIMLHLDMFSVFCLARTNRRLYQVSIIIYHQRTKSFWERFGPYDVMTSLLARHHSIASGPAVLYMLLSTNHLDMQSPVQNSLEIYTTDRGATHMINTLNSVGYAQIEKIYYDPWDSRLVHGRINRSWALQKLVKGGPAQLITVHEALDENPVIPILCFDSTLLMNIMGPSSLFSLYPALTRHKRAIIQHNDKKNQAALRTWQARGFEMLESAEDLCPSFCNRQLVNLQGTGYMHIRIDSVPENTITFHNRSDDLNIDNIDWRFQTTEICQSFDCPRQSSNPSDILLNRIWVDWNAGSF